MEQKINLIYPEKPSFKYSNGAYGSVNLNGDFTMNFFMDRPGNATAVVTKIDDKTKQPIQLFEGEQLIRDVHTQIVMNINAAKEVADWIYRQIEVYKQMRGSNLLGHSDELS